MIGVEITSSVQVFTGSPSVISSEIDVESVCVLCVLKPVITFDINLETLIAFVFFCARQ